MKWLFFFILLVPLFLQADFDRLFPSENPSLVHHVSVISGQLNLSWQDMKVEGAVPLTLTRSYTSGGALGKDTDIFVQNIRTGWMPLGGWDVLSYTNLMVETILPHVHKFRIYVSERNGTNLLYGYRGRKGASKWSSIFKPCRQTPRLSGHLSAKTQPQNNCLIFDLKGQYQILMTPDGGKKYYLGRKMSDYLGKKSYFERPYFYRLDYEILPSGHIIFYRYSPNNDQDLVRMELVSPTRRKIFASIDFKSSREGTVLKNLVMKASDGKSLSYSTTCLGKSYYINHVTSNFGHEEKYQYAMAREGLGTRVDSVVLSSQEKLKITYHTPPDQGLESRWVHHPEEIPFDIDKVKMIESPVGPGGEMKMLAFFSYYKNLTVVCDTTGLLTKYHHDGERLLKIEYFNREGQRHSSQRFYWKESNLVCKALLDEMDRPIFAKTFVYDPIGNVLEESIWGCLSGEESSPLIIEENGQPIGAESYRKTYSYLPEFNTVVEEREENGLCYKYAYKPGTDLVTSRLTYDHDDIVLRSFSFYDEDHLLIAEITDDGTSVESGSLSGITTRLIKRYERNASTGLITTVAEYYFDPQSSKEKLLKRTKLTYADNNLVTEEAVYDADDVYRYTIYMTYDTAGRIATKTTPTGQVNSYTYDAFGQLIASKEIGAALKQFSYDGAGRNTAYKASGKTFHTNYDTKGRVLSETDANGNVIRHAYDDFGHLIKTLFPQSTDENNNAYIPEVIFSYDIQGNLASTTLPRGETTKTWYNVWRKPIRIINPDNSEIRHYYAKDGLLVRTVYEDQSEEHFTRDIFERILSKKLYSAAGSLLLGEEWRYSRTNLLSYKDTRGLITRYTYDGLGRKICEEADGRKTTYSYDSLGFLERTTVGDVFHTEIHDNSGRVVEQWKEDQAGHRENHMRFFYDEENRKIKATRFTSQGEATDHFIYDEENRLIRHSDPFQSVTQFIYTYVINDLGQNVLQKSTVDPIGNIGYETYDVGDRLIDIKKCDPTGQIVFHEKVFHDRSGNKAKRITSAIASGTQIRDSTVTWHHDERGLIVYQEENGQKPTLYQYDLCGRQISKTLPSNLTVSNTYDAAGHVLVTKSSDGTIWQEYVYQGPDLVKMIDHISGCIWERSYNLLGEVVSEKNPLFSLFWEYDDLGRKTLFTLPDNSLIQHIYEGAHMRCVERLSSAGQRLYLHDYTHFDINGHVQCEKLIFGLGFIETGHDLLERPSCQNSPWHTHQLFYGTSGLVTKIHNSLFEDKECSYDALRQLTKEGSHTYSFDSLGNPSDCKINEYNQVVTSADGNILYDADGNPLERTVNGQKVQYRYDALSRLQEVLYPGLRKVSYTYDPLSRLFSKTIYTWRDSQWTEEKKQFYIYDQEKEIGTLNNDLQITELKVLGLGIKGDIGAAVAVELNGTAYAPLHDFMGNIIALVNTQGAIVESYNISAFGQEELRSPPLNPWRFASKRYEESLVFFGLRFYDPHLGRWLTPDPAGYVDGANLYAYVGNSPFNRLDLFGLWQDDFNPMLYIRIPDIPKEPGIAMFSGRALIAGHNVDVMVKCGHWHLLNYSAEEIKAGQINFFDHITELFPTSGSEIALVMSGNGIRVDGQNHRLMFSDIARQTGGTLYFSVHNRTDGLFGDFVRTLGEWLHIETPIVRVTSQMLTTVSTKLYQINQNALWLYIAHSEGGVGLKRSIESSFLDVRQILQRNLLVYAAAPGETIPIKGYAAEVKNVYSTHDNVTRWFAPDSKNCPNSNMPGVNLQWLTPLSDPKDRGLFTEHGFLEPTLRNAWKKEINNKNIEIGFYGFAVQDKESR